jgi:hypothetical protein
MKRGYKFLADKWENQADASSDEREQMWLYACASDLRTEADAEAEKEHKTTKLSEPIFTELESMPEKPNGHLVESLLGNGSSVDDIIKLYEAGII